MRSNTLLLVPLAPVAPPPGASGALACQEAEMEHRRVLVVFAADGSEATVTTEIYRGQTRIQARVTLVTDRSNDLLTAAEAWSQADFPTLF